MFPIFLLALSILAIPPNGDVAFLIRNFVFAVLVMPYVWIVGHPPFAYNDKPWFISPMGALTTGLVWAAVSYFLIVLCSNLRHKRATRT